VRRPAGLAAALATVAVVAACGGASDTPSDAPATGAVQSPAGGAASTPSVSVARTATGVYGARYCELFFLSLGARPIRASVWNTYPFDDCSSARWRAVDTGALARQQNVDYAFTNGPRYWAIDAIAQTGPAASPVEDFGGIHMQLEATLFLDDLDVSPYIEHRVDRHTLFTYDAGRRIAEIHTPGGTFVMQSWSQQIDHTLTDNLPDIGRRLRLPTGWTYTTRVLSVALRVDTTTTSAIVFQDGLDDTFTKEG